MITRRPGKTHQYHTRRVLLVAALCAVFIEKQSFAQSLSAPENMPGSVLAVPGENLVPAAIGVRTDSFGHSWNVEKNGALGRVGSALVNSGLALSVNQQKFEPAEARMTRDGKEFVISGKPMQRLAGVEMRRRIRFLDEKGALRFLELFFNGSGNPVRLDIELATSFSGNYQSAITNRANIEPVLLGPGESGLFITPGSSQANRAFLFVLSSPDASDKPAISSQNRYGLRFQYQIVLQPGETKAIAHVTAQTTVPEEFDRKTLARLFAPFDLSGIADSVPPLFRSAIANDSPRDSFAGIGANELESLQSLGVPPGPDDILADGDQTRLAGKANFPSLKLQTSMGEITVPSDRIAALAGHNGGKRQSTRLYLKDGQILVGESPGAGISFAAKNGTSLEIDLKILDRLVMAKSPKERADQTAAAAPEKGVFVRTWAGSQVKASTSQAWELSGVTPWGRLNLDRRNLLGLRPAAGNFPGSEARLRNGAKLLVRLTGKGLRLDDPLARDLVVPIDQIQSIVTVGENREIRTEEATVLLAGDQAAAGSLPSGEISIYSNGQKLVLKKESIRRIGRNSRHWNDAGSAGHFLVDLWDESRIEGIIPGFQIDLSMSGQQWKIPLTDIRSIELNGPRSNAKDRESAEELIKQLGDESWSIREQATVELSQMGDFLVPILNEELAVNPDPEVRRRLRQVLATKKKDN